MLSFITSANPDPPLPTPTVSVPATASSETQLHLLQAQPVTSSTTPSSAAGSVYSTDPSSAEKASPSAPNVAFSPKNAKYAAGVIPTITNVPLPAPISNLLDNIFGPKDRKIWGLPRNTFTATTLAIVYLLLAMALALGIGYLPYHHPPGYTPETDPKGDSHNSTVDSKDTTNLPLPSTGSINTGQATYYNPALGSCGINSTDNDPIVAVSMILYDAASTGPNPNLNPLCNRKIRATRYRDDIQKNVTIEATVVDRCVGCAVNDLDLSPYLFQKIANLDLGRVDISWAWI